MMSNSSTGIFLGRDASAAAEATWPVAEDDMAGRRSEQGEAWAVGLRKEAKQGARGIKETINGRSGRQASDTVRFALQLMPSGNDGQIVFFFLQKGHIIGLLAEFVRWYHLLENGVWPTKLTI
jgi:hypothetical protein